MSNYKDSIEPAIWFSRTTDNSWSKLGGLPNLPRSISWPRRKMTNKRIIEVLLEVPKISKKLLFLASVITPILNLASYRVRPSMHFIGQIDLSELPETPLEENGPSLPKKGFLFFFANVQMDSVDDFLFSDHWMEWEEDHGIDTRVIYSRFSGAERKPPKDLPALTTDYERDKYELNDPIKKGVFPAHMIKAKNIMSGGERPVSGFSKSEGLFETRLKERDWLANQLGVEVPTTKSWQDCSELSVAMYENYREIEGNMELQGRELHYVRHQMFGLAPTFHNEEGSTRDATGRKGEKAIPLMTFDSDRGVHEKFMFCDAGLLQFWIKPKDLAKRKFNRSYVTTEGG